MTSLTKRARRTHARRRISGVIPRHVARELASEEPACEIPAPIEHDDEPCVRRFFSELPTASDDWRDLDWSASASSAPSIPSGMYWTAAVTLLGLLLNGGLLFYYRVLLPTPVELRTSAPAAAPRMPSASAP